MVSATNSRRRGSTLVFALMAIIAVLAIGVVLISRAGREEPGNATGLESPAVTGSDDELTSPATTIEPDFETTTVEVQPSPVVFPPPPPPPVAATPDPKTLPPEG